MIKNFALTSFAILLLFIFSHEIKAKSLEMRMSFAMSRIEMSPEISTQLKSTVARVAEGYRGRVYSELESGSVQSLLKEIRMHQGRELSDTKAKPILGKLDAILKRHQL